MPPHTTIIVGAGSSGCVLLANGEDRATPAARARRAGAGVCRGLARQPRRL